MLNRCAENEDQSRSNPTVEGMPRDDAAVPLTSTLNSMNTINEFQRRRGIAKARQARAVLLVPGFFVGAVASGFGFMQPFAIALCAVCGAGFFAASFWAQSILRCPNCAQRPLSPEVLKDRNRRFEADAVACIHCGARLK